MVSSLPVKFGKIKIWFLSRSDSFLHSIICFLKLAFPGTLHLGGGAYRSCLWVKAESQRNVAKIDKYLLSL